MSQHRVVTHLSVGGFRLVRKLGSGSRADVYLGHPESVDEAGSAGRQAAIKVYRPGVPIESIDAELAALDRPIHDHCLRLLDVATIETGMPALILERLAPWSLARLLAERSVIEAGEAVTVLAPIAHAVHAMHRAGVTHGSLQTGAIGFRDDGAPVLTRFSAAGVLSEHSTLAQLASQPGVLVDLRQLAVVAGAVLSRARPSPAVTELLGWLDDLGPEPPESFADVLAERLFLMADALPVRLAPAGARGDAGPPSRTITADPVEQPERRRSGVLASIQLPEWIESALDDRLGGERLGRVADHVKRQLASVRRRAWVMLGGVVAAIAAAAVVIPATVDAREPTAVPTIVETAAADVETAVHGDDPIAALIELLEARRRCLSDLSGLCLDAVDQQGSAALTADQALIRSMQAGGEVPPIPSVGSPTLTERLGNSALLGFSSHADSEPASVLLVKGEAGWRIRAWL